MPETGEVQWDDDVARDLIGKRVLVGLTFLRSDGELEGREQFCCRVLSASRDHGFEIEIENQEAGARRRFPPDTRPFQRAEPGHYHLKSVDAVIVDPDYLCMWDITASAR